MAWHCSCLLTISDGANRELSLSFLEAGDIYTTHTPTYVKTVAPSALRMMDIRTFDHKLARCHASVGQPTDRPSRER